MPYSQNGYSANDRSKIATYTIPGTTRRVSLRKGDVSVVLLDFAAWWHREIEKIDTGIFDDWSYAERQIRGGVSLSNHASGTALDLNATKHVLGNSPHRSLSSSQISKIRARLKKYKGVLRWGGDYSGRADTMHVEINKGAAAVREVANLIRANRIDPKPVVAAKYIVHVLSPGSKYQSEVMALQLRLNRILGTSLKVDGDFTHDGFTARAVKRFKSESENELLRSDQDNPVVGPLTVHELGLAKPEVQTQKRKK